MFQHAKANSRVRRGAASLLVVTGAIAALGISFSSDAAPFRQRAFTPAARNVARPAPTTFGQRGFARPATSSPGGFARSAGSHAQAAPAAQARLGVPHRLGAPAALTVDRLAVQARSAGQAGSASLATDCPGVRFQGEVGFTGVPPTGETVSFRVR